jgi:hypothetical protein
MRSTERSLGLTMSELLALPEPLSGLLNWMMRQGQVTVAEATAFLGQDQERTRVLLADLRDKGFVREIEIRGVTHYGVRLAPKRGRALPSNLWPALDENTEQGREEQR